MPTQDDSANAARLAEYTYVTEQFRYLSEIRFKLLMLLPLGTLGGVTFLQSQASGAEGKVIVAAPSAVSVAAGLLVSC